jgi:hypothetical protein
VKVARALNSLCAGLNVYEDIANAKFSKGYEQLNAMDRALVRSTAEDVLLSYIFLCNSSSQHTKCQQDLSNQFPRGIENYPKTLDDAQSLLDLYQKSETTPVVSEVAALAQQSDNGDDKQEEQEGPQEREERQEQG